MKQLLSFILLDLNKTEYSTTTCNYYTTTAATTITTVTTTNNTTFYDVALGLDNNRKVMSLSLFVPKDDRRGHQCNALKGTVRSEKRALVHIL